MVEDLERKLGEMRELAPYADHPGAGAAGGLGAAFLALGARIVPGEEGIRCAVFGGRVEFELEGAEMHALSGEPGRAREDLEALGEELGASLG
jgi:glycerate kinase